MKIAHRDPIVGDVVHYCEGDDDGTKHCRAAIVTGISPAYPSSKRVNLTILCDDGHPPVWLPNVIHHEAGENGAEVFDHSWHWPAHG